MAAELPTDWVTPAEVACALRVSVRTVQRWVATGRLPAVQSSPGRQHSLTRIRVSEVQRFVNPGDSDRVADELADWLTRRDADRAPDLCPRCGRRSIDTTAKTGWCTTCTTERQIAEDERREREKARQRRWWTSHGASWREQRRAAAKEGKADADA